MENHSLYLENKQPFLQQVSRQKRSLMTGVLIVVATFLLFLAGHWYGPHPLFYPLFPLLFLLGGIVHLLLLQKNFSGLSRKKRGLFTVFLTIIAIAFLGAAMFWDERLSWRHVISGAGAFILPYLLAELWQAYAALSYSDAKYWSISNEVPEDLPAIYLKSLKVRFKIIQEPAVRGAGAIRVNASARIPLGDVFLATVQKQNKTDADSVSLKSREGEVYTWVFYKMDFQLWYRILDPSKSLQDNGVGKNALIYVQRVSAETFQETIENKIN